MKKFQSINVVKFNKCKKRHTKNSPRRAPPQIPDCILESDAGFDAIEWLSTPETDPDHFFISSSACFALHVNRCVASRVKPLSRRRFSMIAQKYVRAFRGPGGYRWYELLHEKSLIAKREGVVKSAA